VYQLKVIGDFAAAHSLRNFKGRCEALHGHNWRVEVVVQGDRLNEAGLVMDFAELKKVMNRILDRLDHHHLNETPPFDQINPSSELIAKFLFENIGAQLPPEVEMVSVSAWESEGSCALYMR
jgi:6-pyruvoyltetrahydropterin/6-carboxytetrahydropterin synthase